MSRLIAQMAHRWLIRWISKAKVFRMIWIQVFAWFLPRKCIPDGIYDMQYFSKLSLLFVLAYWCLSPFTCDTIKIVKLPETWHYNNQGGTEKNINALNENTCRAIEGLLEEKMIEGHNWKSKRGEKVIFIFLSITSAIRQWWCRNLSAPDSRPD